MALSFHLISCFFQKEDKTTLKNKHSEFWVEVKNAVLFSVTQYEGYKDQHYICFHTSSICMYHQGKSTAYGGEWVLLHELNTSVHHCYCCLLTPHCVNLPRTCRRRYPCFRYQVAMQDTSPLARANYLSIRDLSWEILNTFREYWPGEPQHGLCCRQNLITECGTQRQGRVLQWVTDK